MRKTERSISHLYDDKIALPNESKKKSKSAKEKQQPKSKTTNTQPMASSKGDYFCALCYVAFEDRGKLDEHMKTHRELEVTTDSCRMEEQPAGVF